MTKSFFRFVLGFLAFIGVSFAITFTIDRYASSEKPVQTASVGATMEQR